MSAMKSEQEVRKERNYAIDLLRIIAMYMVCMIHINLFTGAHAIVAIIPGKEYIFYVGTLTESIGFIGVNLYAIITGYVCLNSKWRFSRYLELWGQVAFYTIVLLYTGWILYRFGVLGVGIDGDFIARNIRLLFMGSSYWYFTAYTALFLLMPFLNKLLLSLGQREYVLMLCVLLLLIPCANTQRGIYLFGSGYNVTWLAVLYAFGAYVKRFAPSVSTKVTAPLALVCILYPLICYQLHDPAVPSYCSLYVAVYSIVFFLFFYRLRIERSWLRKLIAWLAPLSFGVYLLHVHPWSWKVLSYYVPIWNEQLDYPWWIALVLGGILYIICSLLDWGRYHLFLLLRVRRVADFIGRMVEKAVLLQLNRFLPENKGRD